MGNRLCTAEKIPEEHLKPSGIYGDVNAIDYKKLRKLIIKKKLAPCYPGQVGPWLS